MKGGVFFALYALLPVILRIKKSGRPDERELLLFYRTGNFTFGLIFLANVTIWLASDISINNNLIGDNWVLLSASSIVILHGLTGLIIFRKIN